MKLRKYQEEAIDQIRKKYREGKRRIVLCMPTGAGKTVTFVALAKATTEKDPNARVVIFTDRTELLSQAGGAFERVGLEYGRIEAGKGISNHRVQIAMIETFKRRRQKGLIAWHPTLIIVDECHMGNFRAVFDMFDTHVIGVTATPISAKKDEPLSNFYEDIVTPIGVEGLILEGYLVDYIHINRGGIGKAKVIAGEYALTESDVSTLYERVASDVIIGKKHLVYCVSVEHARKMAAELVARGINAKSLSGEDSDRAEKLRWLKNTPDAVLCNVEVLTKGFDEPTVEVIMMVFKTKSLTKYIQVIGRGSRPHAGKDNFVVFDYGSNVDEHGMWNEDRKWSLGVAESKGDGVPPSKTCKAKRMYGDIELECGTVNHAAANHCSSCGADFTKQCDRCGTWNLCRNSVCTTCGHLMSVKEDVVSEKKVTVEQIIEEQKAKGYKPMWVKYRIFKEKDPYPLLLDFQRIMGYKRGWATHAMNEYKDDRN